MTLNRNHQEQAGPETPDLQATYDQLHAAGWNGLGVEAGGTITLALHSSRVPALHPRAVRKLSHQIAPETLHVSFDTLGAQEVTYSGVEGFSRIARFLLDHCAPAED